MQGAMWGFVFGPRTFGHTWRQSRNQTCELSIRGWPRYLHHSRPEGRKQLRWTENYGKTSSKNTNILTLFWNFTFRRVSFSSLIWRWKIMVILVDFMLYTLNQSWLNSDYEFSHEADPLRHPTGKSLLNDKMVWCFPEEVKHASSDSSGFQANFILLWVMLVLTDQDSCF